MTRKNYTEREKRDLIAIVNTFKHIIENKSTNAVFLEQKNAAWDKIATKFNASADQPRTAKQLNTAYQNLKRQTRKKIADDNMQLYIESVTETENNSDHQTIKKFKADNAEDKKAIKATGGGTFTPKLTEVGAQMLALIGDQLKPLSNSCDSAAKYYTVDEIQNDAGPSTINDTNNNHSLLEEICTVKKKKVLNRMPSRKPKQRKNTTETLKNNFYQKKIECAIIEKKNAIKKAKLLDLEIKIKTLEYSLLNK